MDDWHRARQEVNRAMVAYQALVEALLEAEPLIRGSVVRRLSVCGKPGCRCARGEKHGPFWYLCRSEGGRNRMVYLGRDKAEPVLVRVAEYRRWRKLRQRLRKAWQAMEAALDRLEEVLATAGEGGAQAWRAFCGEQMRLVPGKRS